MYWRDECPIRVGQFKKLATPRPSGWAAFGSQRDLPPRKPAVIGGLLASVVPGLRIGGTFYAHLRHPIVTASIANMMQALTDDRFALVLARATPALFAGFDVPDLELIRPCGHVPSGQYRTIACAAQRLGRRCAQDIASPPIHWPPRRQNSLPDNDA
jgi:hypothetical protein